MKTLRKRNITHKNRNGNRKSRNQRGNKRKTHKGGLFGFSGKDKRAKCEPSAPILEIFHQINKVKRHTAAKDTAKIEDHKTRLFTALDQVHCDNIQYLKDLGTEQRGGETPAPRAASWLKDGPTRWFKKQEKPTQVVEPEVVKLQVKPEIDQPLRPVEINTDELDAVEIDQVNEEVLATYTDYLVGLDETKCTKELFKDVKDKKEHIKGLIRFINTNDSSGKSILDTYMAKPKYEKDCIGEAKEAKMKLSKLKAVGGGNKNWMFTRHGPSCNNIATTMQKAAEPNLTDAGIIRLIQHKTKNSDKFKSNYVFVSPLIRTWMTAIILYGIDNKNPLHLFISPFLKEHFKAGFKNGNFPIQLSEQIKGITELLRHLNKMETVKFTPTLVIQFPNGDGAIKSITIDTRNQVAVGDLTTDLYGLNYFSQNWLPSLQGVRTRNAAAFGVFFKPRFSSTKEKFYDALNYAYDGKIYEFVNWVSIHQDKLTKYLSMDTIHIVGHSNLMKSGLKQIDEELRHKKRQGIMMTQNALGTLDTNAWTLLIKNSDISQLDITPGIPKKVKGVDKPWEKNYMCNQKGAVKADAKVYADEKAKEAKAQADEQEKVKEESDERFKQQVDALNKSTKVLASYANEKGNMNI